MRFKPHGIFNDYHMGTGFMYWRLLTTNRADPGIYIFPPSTYLQSCPPTHDTILKVRQVLFHYGHQSTDISQTLYPFNLGKIDVPGRVKSAAREIEQREMGSGFRD